MLETQSSSFLALKHFLFGAGREFTEGEVTKEEVDDDEDENHDLDLASTEDRPHLDRVVRIIIHLMPLTS